MKNKLLVLISLLSAAALSAPRAGAENPCAPDKERFCSSLQRGTPELGKCLRDHFSDLSNGCKHVLKQKVGPREPHKQPRQEPGDKKLPETRQNGPASAAADNAQMRQMVEKAASAAAEKAASAAVEKAASAAEAKRLKAERPSVVSDIDKPRRRATENPDDFALVVGVEKYSADLPSAQFAERDALAAREHLVALGYPERNVKSLIGQRASKSSLEAYLEDWLPRMVKEDSRVFFYFAGHGAPHPKNGQAYLVPADGDPNFLEKTAFPLDKLYADLNALKARRVIVALDSCFSGAGGRSVLPEGVRPLVAKVRTPTAPGGKLTVFAAASADEITGSLKEQGHGIFTYYFLKGLGGEAAEASGAVTPQGLFAYLKTKVQDAASRQNRDQTPILEGVQQGEIARPGKAGPGKQGP